MKHDLHDDLNDRQLRPDEAISYSQQPTVQIQRVSRLRQTNDKENLQSMQQTASTFLQTEMTEEDHQLRTQYGEHKRSSKSRDRQPDTKNPHNFTQLVQSHTQPPAAVNQFKRQNNNTIFQDKYSKLEENFKRLNQNFTTKQAAQTQELPSTDQTQTTQFRLSGDLSCKTASLDVTTKASLLESQMTLFCQKLTECIKQVSVSTDQEASLKSLQTTNFSHFTEQIQQIFAQVISRVYKIESATFLNYKFKDVLHLFETIMAENARLIANDQMPLLLSQIQKARALAGMSILNSVYWQSYHRKTVRSFKRWQGKPGRQSKLGKVLKILQKHNQVRKQVGAFQTWYQSCQQSRESNNLSLLSKLMFYKQTFSECLQSDQGILLHVQALMKSEHSLDVDLLFLRDDEQEVSFFDHKVDSMTSLKLGALYDSVTMDCVAKGLPIKLVQRLLAQRRYDDRIDRPFLMPEVLSSFKHDMSVILIPLFSEEDSSQGGPVGVLRVFKAGQALMTIQLKDHLQSLAQQIQAFLCRVQQLRIQITGLESELQDHRLTSKHSDFERNVKETNLALLSHSYDGKNEFLSFFCQKQESLLDQYFWAQSESEAPALDSWRVRQIFMKSRDMTASLIRIVETPLLPESTTQNKCLVRRRDHKQEKQDMLVDWLDYRHNILMQQISVNTPNMLIVLHKEVPTDTQRLQNLQPAERKTLKMIVEAMEPVLMSGMRLYEDLMVQIQKNEAGVHSYAVNQAVLTSVREQITDGGEYFFSSDDSQKQAFLDLSQVIVSAFTSRDFQVDDFAMMIANPTLEQDDQQMVGYLTSRQASELLSLSEKITHLQHQKSDNVEDDCQDQHSSVDKYEASQSQFKDWKLEQLNYHSNCTEVRILIPDPHCSRVPLAVLAVSLCQDNEHSQTKSLRELTSFLREEMSTSLSKMHHSHLFDQQCRATLQAQQAKNSSLQVKVDFMQAVQENLVQPLTAKPSLKTLGDSLAKLTQRTFQGLFQVSAVQMYHQQRLVCGDLRSYGFSKQANLLQVPEEALVWAVNANLIRLIVPSAKQLTLVLDLSHAATGQDDQLILNCVEFQSVIAPYLEIALSSSFISPTHLLPTAHQHLPHILSRIQKSRECAYFAQLMVQMKCLQVNKAPIFTRLKSFKSVLLRKPLPQDGYISDPKKQFLIKQHVLSVYAQTFKLLNDIGTKTKRRAFNMYKLKVLECLQQDQEQLYALSRYQPNKRQRKAFQIMQTLLLRLAKRAQFSKLAVQCHQYRKLDNSHTKALASVLCICQGFTRIRMRIGFHKMRGNAVDACYRDFEGIASKDRAFFADLQRDTLQTCHDQTTNQKEELETQVTQTLERAIIYLQQTLMPEMLDVIVCSLKKSTDSSKVKGYLFNKATNQQVQAQVNRVGESDVLTRALQENVEMLDTDVFEDFQMSTDQDIILQMLQKSARMFNFTNISNSLYDLYTKQFGTSKDKNIVQRMILIKKARSALLCPLLLTIPSEDGQSEKQQLIGTLELYRYCSDSPQKQQFSKEVEARLKVFTNQLQEQVNLFMQMRQTQSRIRHLKHELDLASSPSESLTSLLKLTTPRAIQKLGADHFQCLVLNHETNLAYFYDFADSYIYNFSFEGTLIDDILEQESVLELSNVLSLNRNQSNLNESSDISIYQVNESHRVRQVQGTLKTITNQGGYQRILYYPVACEGRIQAVFEVGYLPLADQVGIQAGPHQVLNDKAVSLITHFSAQLSHLMLQIKTLAQSSELFIRHKQKLNRAFAFMLLKNSMSHQQKHQEYTSQQSATVGKSQDCLREYMLNIEQYDQELKRLSEQRESLTSEVNALRIDRQTKFRLIGTCLTILNRIERQRARRSLAQGFQTWRQNSKIEKVIETAFNKMLELNYKHANAQYSAASFLLKKSLVRSMKRLSFASILSFAKMNHLKVGSDHILLLDSTQLKQPLSTNNRNGQTMVFSDKNINGSLGLQGSSNFLTGIQHNTDINTKANQSLIASGRQQAPSSHFVQNLNYQNHLQHLHEQMGFGAVPKGVSKREGGTPVLKNNKVSNQSSKQRSKSSKRQAVTPAGVNRAL